MQKRFKIIKAKPHEVTDWQRANNQIYCIIDSITKETYKANESQTWVATFQLCNFVLDNMKEEDWEEEFFKFPMPLL